MQVIGITYRVSYLVKVVTSCKRVCPETSGDCTRLSPVRVIWDLPKEFRCDVGSFTWFVSCPRPFSTPSAPSTPRGGSPRRSNLLSVSFRPSSPSSPTSPVRLSVSGRPETSRTVRSPRPGDRTGSRSPSRGRRRTRFPRRPG